MRVPFGYLRTADNVNITDQGKPVPRAGYGLDTAGSISGAYATLDHQRLYYVDAGALKAKGGPTTIRTGLNSARMTWAEVNQQVFFTNGIDSGIIEADHSLLPWSWTPPRAPSVAVVTGSLPAGKYDVCCTHVLPDGRETGAGEAVSLDIANGQALQVSGIPQLAGGTTRTYLAPANSTEYQLMYSGTQSAIVWDSSPENLGEELHTDGLDPLPSGVSVIQEWRGRMYAALYSGGDSAIFPSEPLGFHLFDLSDGGYIPVKGQVLMLAPTEEALIIGTDRAIHAWDGVTLKPLAAYGVVAGWACALDDDDEGKAFFWTTRGLCRALPFTNLTSSHLRVAPGIQAGAAVVALGGQKHFVACLHAGGSAFNARSA